MSIKKLLLYGLAYPSFFLFSLIVGAYWTFPYDHVRDFVVQEVERGGTVQLEIEELSPSWLTGVELEGVRISSVPADPDAEPSELVLSEVTARVSLFSLMGGTTAVAFSTALEGSGTVEGNFTENEESVHLDAEIADLDLQHLGGVRGLPVTGRGNGTIDLTIGTEAVNTVGTVRLDLRNVSVGDGETPLNEGPGAGLTLERINLGNVELRMEAERGSCRIERLHADGEHARLDGTGAIRLARPLARSGFDNVLLRIKIKDAYRETNPRMETLFSLLELDPEVGRARTPDGALQWQLSGPLSNVRSVPSGRERMPEASE